MHGSFPLAVYPHMYASPYAVPASVTMPYTVRHSDQQPAGTAHTPHPISQLLHAYSSQPAAHQRTA